MALVTAGATIGIGFTGYVRMDMAMLLACVTGGFGAILPSLWLDREHRSVPPLASEVAARLS